MFVLKMSIPRIMHTMWLDSQEYDNIGPPETYPKYHEYEQQWRDLHPNWTHQFWNRRRLDELWDHPKLDRWKKFFYSIERVIERCDFSRYAIMYIYGGVYHDLDFIPLRSLDPLTENREFGWCYEPMLHRGLADWKIWRLYNGFLMSRSQHWIWPLLMDNIVDNYSPTQLVILNTGPSRLSLFADSLNLRETYPDYFIDTCKIIPMDFRNQITPECRFDSLDHAYCYTRWKEGTNWGGNNIITSLTQRPETPGLLILALVLLVIVIVLIVRSMIHTS
jgi:mannosyltransferase OCH1-like enzyme